MGHNTWTLLLHAIAAVDFKISCLHLFAYETKHIETPLGKEQNIVVFQDPKHQMAITHGPPKPMELATGPRWVPAFTSSVGLRWLCSLASKFMLMMIHWYTLITTRQCTLLVKLQRLFLFHFLDFVCVFFSMSKNAENFCWSPESWPNIENYHGNDNHEVYCLIIHRKTMRRNLFGTKFLVLIRRGETCSGLVSGGWPTTFLNVVNPGWD